MEDQLAKAAEMEIKAVETIINLIIITYNKGIITIPNKEMP